MNAPRFPGSANAPQTPHNVGLGVCEAVGWAARTAVAVCGRNMISCFMPVVVHVSWEQQPT